MSTRLARLPGLRFEAQPPASPDVLPRMDVACFVGFASGGPFHVPVAIDDPAQMTARFGADLPLAVDPETGEVAYAQLAPAVRAFLRGGGRRCWVIRAGEDAGLAPLAFPVPGLARRDGAGRLAPAWLPARSPGTWAEDLRVGAALESDPAAVTELEQPPGGLVLNLSLARGQDARAGDLIRLHGGRWTLLAPARPVAGRPGWAALDLARAVWTRPVRAADLGSGTATATAFGPDGVERVWAASDRTIDEHGRLRIDVATAAAAAPLPGTLVALRGLGAADAWLLVDELRAAQPGVTGLVGAGAFAATAVPGDWTPPEAAAATAEILTMELWVRRAGATTARLAGLGFAPEHARWIGRLPPDGERFAPAPPGPASPPPGLWGEAAGLPLCGAGLGADDVLVPLALAIVPALFLGAPPPTDPPLRRDGIPAVEGSAADDAFGQRTMAAFLDPELAELGMRALGAAADHIRYQAPVPRPLRGVHAAMGLDEVTLLAVPDAVQRACITVEDPPLPAVTAPRELPHPDPAVFHACSLRELATPTLSLEGPDAAGAATLTWTPTDDPSADYLLQGSADPVQFSPAETLYDGRLTSVAVDARGVGPFVRVRAHSAHGDSNWSNGLAISAGRVRHGTLAPSGAFRADALLAIQRATLRACGSRGDILAVLSLPGHYREDDAIRHAAELRSGRSATLPVAPIDAGEEAALAHGAIYHPWPTVILDGSGPLRRLVPDGQAAGVLSLRARSPGAWVAPAAVALHDVVALVPAAGRSRLLELQEARVNTLRQDPAGFVVLAEETLAGDPDQRAINVRRLLDLLRRLALLHGPEYVFASNDARLARRVQRGFERVLRRLYNAGAFAGATTSEAYEVLAWAPRGGDSGQLVVELRVAPSLPMRFLTVRLLQGGGGAEIQEA